jgi:septal ring factor EnvC (AmiA/AmiB activator)
VHKEKEFYAKAVEELKEAADALNQTMRHLEREEKERALPGGLAEMKGALPVPVKGKVLSGVTLSRGNPLIHRKGVYIHSAPGEEVKSVFGGRVEFSGWFKGYGQLMIVKHGSRYFTVFAHLDERAKEKGDMVSGGEVLGIVGNAGGEVGPGVYFEIRKGRQQLDPRTWLAIE